MDGRLVRAFPATRHSAVAAARSADPEERARGLETLSTVYWRPVYSHLRLRWRFSHEDAGELTQEIFAELVAKDWMARFDPSRARLRTYLRACVDGVAANHTRAAARQKRGGARAVHVELDEARAEVEGVNPDAPDAAFDRQWSRGVFALALQRLREELTARGKAEHYALLEACDLGAAPLTYAELSTRFGIPVTDVTNRLFRTRRELRRVLVELLREITGSEEELRDELRALVGAGA